MFNIKRKKKGVTLIEVIISFAILSIVLGPMFGMISLGVRTNKTGENTQKGLYAVQKYAEKFKSPDIFKFSDTFQNNSSQIFTNTQDSDIPYGYFVKVDITPMPEYEFGDAATAAASTTDSSVTAADSDTSDVYDDISYDAKIIIQKNADKNYPQLANLYVEDNSENKQGSTVAVDNNYTLYIGNGSNVEGDKRLTIKFTDESGNEVYTLPDTFIKRNGDNASIVIQIDASQSDSSQSINLKIDYANYVYSSNMSIYYVRTKDISTTGNYDLIKPSFENERGTAKIYDNIYIKNNSDSNNVKYSNTRLYKISVKLFKDGQNTDPVSGDKPIQQVNAYRVFQQ